MKLINFINKVVGLLIFPLLVYYIFTGYEITSQNEIYYYPELMGFYNEHSTVSSDEIGLVSFLLTVVSGVILTRYIRFLGTFRDNDADVMAKDTSENLSNILDIGYFYILIKFILSLRYMDNPLFLSILVSIMCLGFIVWKICECSASVNGNDEGLFNLRKSLENHFYKLKNYNKNKTSLIKNYKRITS